MVSWFAEKIRIYKPPYQGGNFRSSAEKVWRKWDIEKVDGDRYTHLMGDAVDNIPGIKGVGEKTAAKLVIRNTAAWKE